MNDELKKAAWLLKEYCSNRACCEGCQFKRKPTYRLQEVCKIGYPVECPLEITGEEYGTDNIS